MKLLKSLLSKISRWLGLAKTPPPGMVGIYDAWNSRKPSRYLPAHHELAHRLLEKAGREEQKTPGAGI